jgi:hypothetical protein
MEEHGDWTSGVCPGASTNGETVSIDVPHTPPLLQRKRALPWEALFEVMTRHGRRAGKKTDGRPGLAWDVTLSVPLVVLMLVKTLNARDRESSRAEQVVARGFIGRQDAPRPQIRDHSNVARAYPALGKDGVEEIKALILRVAQAFGFAEARILSADTTAQALPMGSPNAPGMVRGVAQRGGRALAKRTRRGVLGGDRALEQVQTILRSVKEPPLFAKSKDEKRQGLTRLLTEGGPWIVQTRPLVARLAPSRDCVPPSAPATLAAMHEVAQRLIPPIVPWITTAVVAKGTIVQAGLTQARALVRTKAGKQGAFGWPYLLSRLGGG